MKIVFLDTSDFSKIKNIKVKYKTLRKEKILIEIKKEENNTEKIYQYLGYGSVLSRLGELSIYYTLWRGKKENAFHHSANICLMKKNSCGELILPNIASDEAFFSVFDGGLIANHFCIFDDKLNDKMKMIGGVYILKDKIKSFMKKGRGHSQACFNSSKFITYMRPAEDGSMVPFTILDPNVSQPCKNNGLYILDSEDGIKWHYVLDKPLTMPMDNDSLKYNLPQYDSQPSCFYDPIKQMYFLYVRKNVRPGVRYVNLFTSKNFLNWKGPLDIKLQPAFDFLEDNLYVMNVNKYDGSNFYYGFLNLSNEIKKTNFIYLYISVDGINWKRISKLLMCPDFKHSGNFIHTGCPVLSPKKDKFLIYLSAMQKAIVEYSLRRDDFGHFFSTNGTFRTKLLNRNNDYIKINFKTKQDGFILVTIRDEKNIAIKGHTFKDCNILTGDSFKELVKWNNNKSLPAVSVFYIDIYLKNASIYSLKY